MQLNVEELDPEYEAIRRNYLEAMEDETIARIEYEGNRVSIELKKTLTEAAKLWKKMKN
jgi:hypothetical protein